MAVTAGIVMLVTQGRGTDHIITPSTTPTQTDTNPQTDTSNQNNGLPQPGITDGSNDSNTKDSTSGSSNDGTDSSTSGLNRHRLLNRFQHQRIHRWFDRHRFLH